MAIERTLSIVKPDAMSKKCLGSIISRFEAAGLNITEGKIIKMSRTDAEQFYNEHRERPFFGELVEYMTSGPVFVSVLEGEGAVLLNRKLMGATNPKDAEPGTIRADFGEGISANAVHGSDSLESANREIAIFFS